MKITRVSLKLLQKKKQLHNFHADNLICCDRCENMFTLTFALADDRMQDLTITFFNKKPEVYISDPYTFNNYSGDEVYKQ